MIGPIIFMVLWIAFCGSVIAGCMNYDRVALFVLCAIDAPVYEEARMIAALIYQHPEQWKPDTYSLGHPKVGRIRTSYSARSVEVDGPYGHWEPNAIERRIIWDAVQWYRRSYIKSLLRKEIA